MSRPGLAADRAMQVLDLLITHPTEAFTLSEISSRTGINRASAHAIVKVLEQHGYLRRHRSQRTFSLGPTLVPAAAVAMRQIPALSEAVRRLDGLSAECGLEVAITMPIGTSLLTVARSEYVSEFGAPHREGHTVPWRPPLGCAYLAFSPRSDVDEWLARSPELPAAKVAQLERVLEFVKTNGYSVAVESSTRRGVEQRISQAEHADHSDDPALGELLLQLAASPYQLDSIDSEAVYAVSSIVAPVFDPDGAVVFALHVTGFAPTQSGDEIVSVAQRIRGAATLISKIADGKLPDAPWV